MLRRWAPQAAPPLRPTPPPPARALQPQFQGRPPMRLADDKVPHDRVLAPSKVQVWDRWMPPAGQPADSIARESFGERPPRRGPAGIAATRRQQRAQKGTGVAAALDSWGDWRNWEEDN